MLGARFGQGALRSASRQYSTDFSTAEFANGLWILGGTTGLDWTDPTVSSGHAFGTQTGSGGFNDSIADYSPIITSISQITTTVFIDAATAPTGVIEFEHLHRRTTTAHSSSGYECNFGNANGPGGAYADIISWRGPLGTTIGDFDWIVPTGTFNSGGFSTGDQVRTTMAGDTITCEINRGAGFFQLYSVSDTGGSDGHARWKSGRMGVGMYRESSNNAANKVAFTSLFMKSA